MISVRDQQRSGLEVENNIDSYKDWKIYEFVCERNIQKKFGIREKICVQYWTRYQKR
jgi:hypothetical protein